jgi:alpha-glucosidase (family GH31 glycosyl hydrolase)
VQRSVVLPASDTGGWYLFGGGQEVFPPGRYTVDAPLGKSPIFVRAGRILPTKPAKPHTGAQQAEELELQVFFDARTRATGSVWEDDGETRGAPGQLVELSARVQRGRVLIDAFADGREVLDRAWHVQARGVPSAKS